MGKITNKGEDFYIENESEFDCSEDHVNKETKLTPQFTEDEKKIIVEMPNFKARNLPFVKVKSMYVNNYKIFHDYFIDFTKDGEVDNFACFIGPNGCGKSTSLELVQAIFSNYDQYDQTRLVSKLGKCVRKKTGNDHSGVYGDSDFRIRASLASTLGDYEVILTKKGFTTDHPDKIKNLISRLCYFTRFDQELNKFQLANEKWPIFKELFEAVTGFEIEKEETDFAIGSSRHAKEFVFGFYVKKPNETIHYKECSDGERKIMKSFSSLLNLEYSPSIILIDNVEMHVESGRHLPLIQAMKRCFEDSQIITTTHSYHISRNFSDKHQVKDLRLLNCSDIYKMEPWRLQVFDEVKDALVKLETFDNSDEIYDDGLELIKRLNFPIEDKADFRADLKQFMIDVVCCFVEDML